MCLEELEQEVREQHEGKRITKPTTDIDAYSSCIVGRLSSWGEDFREEFYRQEVWIREPELFGYQLFLLGILKAKLEDGRVECVLLLLVLGCSGVRMCGFTRYRETDLLLSGGDWVLENNVLMGLNFGTMKISFEFVIEVPIHG